MKRAFVILSLTAGVLALAANSVVGAQGLGAALATNGMRWAFSLDGKRTNSGTTLTTGGFTRFRRDVVENGHRIVTDLFMQCPDEVKKQGGIVNYVGKTRYRQTRDGALVREVYGRMSVTATDRRAAGVTTGEPDLVTFRWAATGLPVIEFTGKVVSGDVVVYERLQ